LLFYYFAQNIYLKRNGLVTLILLCKLSLSKTPRLLVYVISLIKTFIRIFIVTGLLKKNRKIEKFKFHLKFIVYRFLYIKFKNVWAYQTLVSYVTSLHLIRVNLGQNV
jgi:hypothetical protein